MWLVINPNITPLMHTSLML